MEETVEYFCVRHGFKPGKVPNRITFLYRKYLRWFEVEFPDGEGAPLPQWRFREGLLGLGFKVVRRYDESLVLGNKWLVGKSKKQQERHRSRVNKSAGL